MAMLSSKRISEEGRADVFTVTASADKVLLVRALFTTGAACSYRVALGSP
jgi:hypothetical protein